MGLLPLDTNRRGGDDDETFQTFTSVLPVQGALQTVAMAAFASSEAVLLRQYRLQLGKFMHASHVHVTVMLGRDSDSDNCELKSGCTISFLDSVVFQPCAMLCFVVSTWPVRVSGFGGPNGHSNLWKLGQYNTSHIVTGAEWMFFAVMDVEENNEVVSPRVRHAKQIQVTDC